MEEEITHATWSFAARAAERARIRQLVSEHVGALIVGDSGVGKTALATHTLADHNPLSITGYASERHRPFQAISNLVPIGALESGDNAHSIALAAHLLGQILSDSGSQIIVVDDAHLLDSSTADTLLRLSRERSATVVATSRPEMRVPAIEQAWREGLWERIDLLPLNNYDVAVVIATALASLTTGNPEPTLVDEYVVRAFTALSTGNPLLLRELVNAALHQNTLVRDRHTWRLNGHTHVPGGVRNLVDTELDLLPPELRHGLEIVAACEPLPLAIATDMLGSHILEVLDSEQLILCEEEHGNILVRSKTPLFGAVLRESISPLRQRRFDLDFVERIEDERSSGLHLQVRAALLRQQHNEPGDPELLLPAVNHALLIDPVAANRLAHFATATAQDAQLRARAQIAHIQLMLNSADWQGLNAPLEVLAELPPLVGASQDIEVLGHALSGAWKSRSIAGAVRVLRHSLADQQVFNRDLIRGALSLALLSDAKLVPARKLAGRVLEPARNLRTKPRPELARALAAVAMVGTDMHAGAFSRVEETVLDTLPLAQRLASTLPFAAPMLSSQRIIALARSGKIEYASNEVERMRERAKRDAPSGANIEPSHHYAEGFIALLRGTPSTAIRSLHSYLKAPRAQQYQSAKYPAAMLAHAQAQAADPASARATLALYEHEVQIKTFANLADSAQIAILGAESRGAEATALALDLAQHADRERLSRVAAQHYYEACRHGGSHTASTASLELAAAAGNIEGTLSTAQLAHAKAIASGDPAQLEAAATRLLNLGALLWASEAFAEAALGYLTQNEHTAATRNATAYRALRKQGVGSERPPLNAAMQVMMLLSSAERQVAVLAAQGHSNSTIAEQLFLSVRTVESHIATSYKKLGVHNRAALAELLRSARHLSGSPDDEHSHNTERQPDSPPS